MRTKIVLFGFILTIISLFLYSFTQVDLGLTLTRSSIYQTVEKNFQYIGYFQRQLSAEIYIVIILLMFVFYVSILKLISLGLISKKQIWGLIFATSIILTFSYNAFSYDLFNYIFDAKILTHYGQNPYAHKALDFPGDPMLSFMHWTQRNYPYGPVWLVVTVPLSYLGLGFFLPTFFLFKALSTAGFLMSCYFLQKIIKKMFPDRELFGLAFFAFNPLIIIESLVSSHNDLFMMGLALGSLSIFLDKKYLRSIILFIISVGVKFATVFIIPALLLEFIISKGFRKISNERLLILISISMVAAVVAASLRTNFQPWYLLYVLPFSAIISSKYYVFIPSVVISFSALFIYVPFLLSGNWDPPIPSQLFWIMTIGIILSLLSVLLFRTKNLLK